MKTSDVGKKLIKKYEGLRLTAYSDAVGIKTIGYGHTGKIFRIKLLKQKQKYILKLMY